MRAFSLRSLFPRIPSAIAVLAAALGAGLMAGCTPSVGDSCNASTDCSAAGDRQCDTSQPGGYCTVVSCGANACPGNSACVAFQPNVAGCRYTDRSVARTARSYCMKKCGQDSDCRTGYICRDPLAAPWFAIKLDDKQSFQTCIPAPPDTSLPVEIADEDAGVCQASIGGGIPIPLDPTDAGADADAANPDGGIDDADAADGAD